MKSRILGTVCVSLVLFWINASTYAADYTFTKIVDSNDIIPGRNGTFTEFDLPSLDGRDVAFVGGRNFNYSGVFTYIAGSRNLVADSNTAIPGGAGNFDWLSLAVLDRGNVVFAGGNRTTQQNGIYTDLGANLGVVADQSTPIPGRTGTFGFLSDEDHSISNGVVAFRGYDDFPGSGGKPGIYTYINGNLSIVVDPNTSVPGGSGNFEFLSFRGMNGSDIAFGGGDFGVSGLYLNSGGIISTIASEGGEMDVSAGTFEYIEGPDFAQLSLNSNVGGTLHVVAEIGDITPDGVGHFTFFDNTAVDGDELAFVAVDDNGDGNIYRYSGGALDEVISIGDMLDGKSVIDLNMYSQGFDDSAIAFRVDFEDGSTGIYLATASVTGRKTDIVIDFGAIGLWARMNDSSWLKLNNASPDQVAIGDMDGNGQDDVIADFSSTLGGIFVKRNLGAWSKLHNFTPETMAVGDLDNNGKDDLVIDFGAIGLWARMNDMSWLKLNNSSPDQVVVGDMDSNGQDDVIADFTSTIGGLFVKRNLGAWSKLHNFGSETLAVGDLDNSGEDDVVIDFGVIGLWARMNDASWLKLHNSSPDLVVTGDVDGNGADDVLATFTGQGFWQKLNVGGWSKLNNNAPDAVVTGDVDGSGQDDIVASFGVSVGGIFVRRDQGAWVKLHNMSPGGISAGTLDSQ